MAKLKKVMFTRGSVERPFQQDHIDRFSTPEKKWPESEGWVRVPGEVSASKKEKEKEEAEPTGSTTYKTSPDQLEEIRTQLTGKKPTEITAFFDGDERSTMKKLMDELLGN